MESDPHILTYRRTQYFKRFKDAHGTEEYKSEWRQYLADENLKQIRLSFISDRKTLRFSFYRKTVIKKVFDICEMLKQSPEVRYLALDILDRFMVHHFFDVAKTVNDNETWTKRSWKIIACRLVHQSLLRILSSIQIASKYCSSYMAIPTAQICKVLNTVSQKFRITKRDIAKSEARVYQTLKFSIPTVTPLTYIEMFIEDFKGKELMRRLELSLNEFLSICINVLDIATFFHREIFQILHMRVTGRRYQLPKNLQFLSVEADYMYLGASVIYTAAKVQDPTGVAPNIFLKFFSSATQYKEREIEFLGTVILEVIIHR